MAFSPQAVHCGPILSNIRIDTRGISDPPARGQKSDAQCLSYTALERQADVGLQLIRIGLPIGVAALLSLSAQAQTSNASASGQLHTLFDEYRETLLRETPTYATFLGDRRYDDQLEDLSADGTRRRRAQRSDLIRRLENIDPIALEGRDRVSRSVLLYALRSEVRGDRLLGDLPLEFAMFRSPTPVTQMNGPQFWLPLVVKSTHFGGVRDYENYLKRLAALPGYAAGVIARLQAGIDSRWMPPRITLRNVPGQFAPLADPDPAQNPFFTPFQSFPADVSAADIKRLRNAGETAIRDLAAPAFAKLKSFLETRYLPAAGEQIAASKLPHHHSTNAAPSCD